MNDKTFEIDLDAGIILQEFSDDELVEELKDRGVLETKKKEIPEGYTSKDLMIETIKKYCDIKGLSYHTATPELVYKIIDELKEIVHGRDTDTTGD